MFNIFLSLSLFYQLPRYSTALPVFRTDFMKNYIEDDQQKVLFDGMRIKSSHIIVLTENDPSQIKKSEQNKKDFQKMIMN